MVAKIGRHDIYTIKDTKMIRLFKYTENEKETTIEEERKYKNIFQSFDLTK